ncbi:DNA replication protein DnaC [Bradyrhizobium barranii subsp. barranii]
MAKAFEEQRRSPDLEALPFEDRIGLLVDREAAERDTRRLTTRLKIAALRQTACVEDVDLRTPRGIDRAVFAKLVAPRVTSNSSGCGQSNSSTREAGQGTVSLSLFPGQELQRLL